MNNWAKDGGELFILIKWYKGFFCPKLLIWYDLIIYFEDAIAVGNIVAIAAHNTFCELTYITVSVWKYHHSVAWKKAKLEITVEVFLICGEHTQPERHAFCLRPIINTKFALNLW